nr:hypothetical protein FRC0137_00407 [Corynebacterium diphtheriae]
MCCGGECHQECCEDTRKTEQNVGDQSNGCVFKGQHGCDDDGSKAVESHDVAKEEQEAVDHAEHGEEQVAFDQRTAGLGKAEVFADHADGDQTDAESEQRGEHRQAAVMDEHGGEQHCDFIERGVYWAENSYSHPC